MALALRLRAGTGMASRVMAAPRARCGPSRRTFRVFFELDELAAHLALQPLAELEEVVAERLLHVDGALDERAGDDDVGARLDGLLRGVGGAQAAADDDG